MGGTVLSKRKIQKLVQNRYVRSWDDPRLYTLPALRRRGIPPGAILSFVNELGVTKATSNIEIKRFETSIRRYLEFTVPRLMVVLDPIRVIIDDLPDDHLEMIELPFSKDPAYGVSHPTTLNSSKSHLWALQREVQESMIGSLEIASSVRDSSHLFFRSTVSSFDRYLANHSILRTLVTFHCQG